MRSAEAFARLHHEPGTISASPLRLRLFVRHGVGAASRGAHRRELATTTDSGQLRGGRLRYITGAGGSSGRS